MDTTELPPGVAESEQEKPKPPKPKAKPKPKTERKEISIEALSVEVPVLRGLSGYTKRNVYVRFDSGVQAQSCRDLLAGLQEHDAALANGKLVRSPADAIKYVLELLQN